MVGQQGSSPNHDARTPHFGFRDKRVVVTGAASGIGHRVAELLLEAGAQVIALDRSDVDLPVTQFVRVDMTDPASIDAAIGAIAGEVDVLLNIAGVPGTADPEIFSIHCFLTQIAAFLIFYIKFFELLCICIECFV